MILCSWGKNLGGAAFATFAAFAALHSYSLTMFNRHKKK